VKYSGQDFLLGSLLLALALILPILFHAVGLGSAFLPMFYPILTAGFLIAWPVAAAVGFLAPLTSALLTGTSALLTGMPPLFPPIAPIMMMEGLVLTSLPYWLHQKHSLKIIPTMVVTVAAERAVLLAAVVLLAKWLELPEGVLGLISVARGLPGIVIIFIIIPPLVKKLEQRIKHQWLLE